MSGRLPMYDPLFDARIEDLVAEIVNLGVVDYINALIYLKKNSSKDPLAYDMIRRRLLVKECEQFFLEEYEYMTGKDGEKKMRECKKFAQERTTHINRKRMRRPDEADRSRVRKKQRAVQRVSERRPGTPKPGEAPCPMRDRAGVEARLAHDASGRGKDSHKVAPAAGEQSQGAIKNTQLDYTVREEVMSNVL